jgi:hypothetical protein
MTPKNLARPSHFLFQLTSEFKKNKIICEILLFGVLHKIIRRENEKDKITISLITERKIVKLIFLNTN